MTLTGDNRVEVMSARNRSLLERWGPRGPKELEVAGRYVPFTSNETVYHTHLLISSLSSAR